MTERVLHSDDVLLASVDRHYAQINGAAISLNAWLKLMIVVLVAVVFGQQWQNVQVHKQYAHMVPLVMKDYADGRVDVVRYEAATWQATEAHVRHFLGRFIELHFSLKKSEVARDYDASLRFLDRPVEQARIQDETSGIAASKFVQSPTSDEIQAQATQVAITEKFQGKDGRLIGGKAIVDFEKIYLIPRTQQARLTQAYKAAITFTLPEKASNDIIPVNPIGLKITSLSVYEAF